MFCGKCGKELPEGTTVCESCTGSAPPSPPFQDTYRPQPAYSIPDSVEKSKNGMAIASLVLGLVGIIPFLGLMGIVGLILGIVALNQIKSSWGRQKGHGLAVAGIVLGAIGTAGLVLSPILAAILFPVFAKAREKARQSTCATNLHKLSNAAMMYAQDYDDKFPLAGSWSDVFASYEKDKKVFTCPAFKASGGYSLYGKLEGVSMTNITEPFSTPMLFDTNTGWNSSAPIEEAVERHNGGYNCGFADGHVKLMNYEIPAGL